ncbi:excinuclease ABC subunit UvrA [Lacunimicrobium album]
MSIATTKTLQLTGVRERTLKEISVELPLGKFILVTGVSGAGKSSLVVETIFAESQRRYLETFSPTIRQQLSGVKTPALDHADGLVNCLLITNEGDRFPKRKPVWEVLDADEAVRQLFVRGSEIHCPVCGERIRTWTAETLTDELIATAEGQRAVIGFPTETPSPNTDPARLISLDKTRKLQVIDRVKVQAEDRGRIHESIELSMMEGEGRCVVLVESDTGSIEYSGRIFEQHIYSRLPYCWKDDRWVVMPSWSWDEPTGETDENAFGFMKLTFRELLSLTSSELYERLLRHSMAEETNVVVRNARQQLIDVCRVLIELGLGHLHVGQRYGELSGGERTRLLLTSVNMLAPVESMLIIDELSPGQSDEVLSDVIGSLKQLVHAGNTVVVVDHHSMLASSVDWIIELGPGAGTEGGTVIFNGPSKEWYAKPESLTLSISEPPKKRSWAKLDDLPSTTFDLKDAKLLLGRINAVTGPRGKSRFLKEVLFGWAQGQPSEDATSKKKTRTKTGLFDEVVLVDQERISGSKRSMPASIMKLMPEIRDLFAESMEAQLRNWNSRYFSLHVEGGGRCPRCTGVGEVEVDLKHLALVSVVCPECNGTRYLPEVLNARYRGLSIAEVLNLSVDEAFLFFRSQMSIQKKLQVMRELGLGYIRLGQPTRTLSSGETQRLKIATNIVTISAKKKLFLLDEPTAGLHASEIAKLWTTLQELTAGGHTVVIAEHDAAVIDAADHRVHIRPATNPSERFLVSNAD